MSFLYLTRHLVSIYICTKSQQNIPKGIQVTERTKGFTPMRRQRDPFKKQYAPTPLIEAGGGHNDQKRTILCIYFKILYIQLASIGQSDAPLTGDKEVEDSITARSATFSFRLTTSRKHTYIILTPLNPTFI